jgi:hypothetical protein
VSAEEWPDDARRLADAVNLHITAIGVDAYGKWVAAKLSDGTPDPDLYDTKTDAVRHQLDETMCVYVCITPPHMTYKEATALLRFTRALYDGGYRMPHPEHEIVMPIDFERTP